MGEATRDKQNSTSESKKDKEKTHGWIRIHSDNDKRPPPVDEPKEIEAQSPPRKPRRELEKPTE
jgi:hypothetical protein